MKELNNCISFFEDVSKFETNNKNSKETIEAIKKAFIELCPNIDIKVWSITKRNFELLKTISFLSLNLFCKRTNSDLKQTIQDWIEIMKRKNSDYAGDLDFFKNFKNSQFYWITSNERGFLVRMSDKISRIETLIWNDKEKENKVQDEKVEDTLKDLSNYCSLLYSYIVCNLDRNKSILSVYVVKDLFEILIIDEFWKIRFFESWYIDQSNYIWIYKYLVSILNKSSIWKIIYEWEWLDETIWMIKNSFKQIKDIVKINSNEKDFDDDFHNRVLNFYKWYKKATWEENLDQQYIKSLETISNYLFDKSNNK